MRDGALKGQLGEIIVSTLREDGGAWTFDEITDHVRRADGLAGMSRTTIVSAIRAQKKCGWVSIGEDHRVTALTEEEIKARACDRCGVTNNVDGSAVRRDPIKEVYRCQECWHKHYQREVTEAHAVAMTCGPDDVEPREVAPPVPVVEEPPEPVEPAPITLAVQPSAIGAEDPRGDQDDVFGLKINLPGWVIDRIRVEAHILKMSMADALANAISWRYEDGNFQETLSTAYADEHQASRAPNCECWMCMKWEKRTALCSACQEKVDAAQWAGTPIGSTK